MHRVKSNNFYSPIMQNHKRHPKSSIVTDMVVRMVFIIMNLHAERESWNLNTIASLILYPIEEKEEKNDKVENVG